MGYSLAVQYNGGGCSEHLLGSMVNKKRINNNNSMTTNKNDFRKPSKKNLKIQITNRDLQYAFK